MNTKKTKAYNWGSVCQAHWNKAYIVLSLTGWNSRLSSKSLSTVALFSPYMEVYENGDVIINVTHQQKAYNSVVTMLNEILAALPKDERSMLRVGLANSPMVAYLAACYNDKPHTKIIPEWDQQRILQSMPVEALDCLQTGISAFVKQFNVNTFGEIKYLSPHYLTNRFGSIGRSILLLSANKTADIQQWNTKTPKVMMVGGNVPRGSTMDIKSITLFDNLYQRLNRQVEKRGLEYARLVFEQVLHSGEVKRTILESREDVRLLMSKDCAQIRLLALDLSPYKVQADLFSMLSPVKELMMGVIRGNLQAA